MKLFSSQKQPLSRSSLAAGMALGVTFLVFTGCGKAKSPAAGTPVPSTESVNQGQVENSPSSTVASPTPAKARIVIAAPNGEPDMVELNRSLLRWIVGHRRPPANFEDFAATAGVTIPPPPAGKKYIIAKNMHVQLANK